MAIIASVFSRATPEHQSEEGSIATLALFSFAGLVISLLAFGSGVELYAEFF